MGRPPSFLGLSQRSVTDLLSKSTILGSPGWLGGPEEDVVKDEIDRAGTVLYLSVLTVWVLCQDGVSCEQRL